MPTGQCSTVRYSAQSPSALEQSNEQQDLRQTRRAQEDLFMKSIAIRHDNPSEMNGEEEMSRVGHCLCAKEDDAATAQTVRLTAATWALKRREHKVEMSLFR